MNCWGKMSNGAATMDNSMAVPQKIRNACDPAIPLLAVLERIKSRSRRDICAPVFIAASAVAKERQHPECPSASERTVKCAHRGAWGRPEKEGNSDTCYNPDDPDDTAVSERSHEKTNAVRRHPREAPRVVAVAGAESGVSAARSWRRRVRGRMGTWSHADSFILTPWKAWREPAVVMVAQQRDYLMPLNWTPKMITIANFMLRAFYLN